MSHCGKPRRRKSLLEFLCNPKGTTFALFPSIVLDPPWTKKYFLKLQAIEILGSDKTWGIGGFKSQSYLIAQFQYNFNLM